MSSIHVARPRWLLLTAVIPLLTSCASVSRLHPDVRENAGVVRVTQVVALATRQQILAFGKNYDHLIASGIRDADLRDESVARGRLYCCGGPNLDLWFYVPHGMDVGVGDIVEVKMGRQADNQDRGMVNVATQVSHKRVDAEKHCRWDPPNERLWMRILYCDWMEKEGWEEQGGLNKTWAKPASTTAAP
jgi:hypothetical protein